MVLGQKETTRRRKDWMTETETKVENEQKQLEGRQGGSARGWPESQCVRSLPHVYSYRSLCFCVLRSSQSAASHGDSATWDPARVAQHHTYQDM